MIFIISDLHLTDGSTSSNIDPSAWEYVKNEIIVNALKRNAKEVRIVLLGDIFDMMRTDFWVGEVPKNERPWNGNLDLKTGMNDKTEIIEKHFITALNKIFDNNEGKNSASKFIEMLTSLKKEMGGKYLKLTYIIGNHDRALNNFDYLKSIIENKLRTPENPNQNFDSIEFLNVLYAPEYNLLARHGHEWDDDNFGYEFHNKVLNSGNKIERFSSEAYKVQAIGEVVKAELMAGLIWRLRKKIKYEEFIIQIMEVNNLRPMLNSLKWLDWFASTQIMQQDKDTIIKCLSESINAVLESKFAEKWDDLKTDLILSGDLTDYLSNILKIIEGKTFEEAKLAVNLATFFADIFEKKKDDLTVGAEKEWDNPDFKDIQYIVYGHTHNAKYDVFEGSQNGKVKSYINSGTFLPLIEPAISEGYFTAYRMTMLCFYKDEEDDNKNGNVSVDIWNGLKRKNY